MINRREFIQLLMTASIAGLLPRSVFSQTKLGNELYEFPKFGNTRLLHFTDCHAQLLPIYYREPHVNIGVGKANGAPPHIVGKNLLKHFNLAPNGPEAHAFTYLNYAQATKQYGKVGGFAHLATLIKKLRRCCRRTKIVCYLMAAILGKGPAPR